MSATEQHVREQCKRLASAPAIEPKSTEGKREIRDALLRHCQSDEHVTAVITKLLYGTEDTHNPVAALVRIAKEIEQEMLDAERLPRGCDDCQGTGWYRYTKLIKPGPHVDPYMAEFSTYCKCEAGQWRKTKVREVEAK